jgi:cyclophilin family peptidyl-prolyl cis-trans isomerase
MTAALALLLLSALALIAAPPAAAAPPRLSAISSARLVLQLEQGSLHLAFYDDVAPISAAHILRLGELGAYNTNHFFRVDKGFVAQVADVGGGRAAPLDAAQRAEEDKRVPLEVFKGVQHDRRGLLSMARHDDPESGGSSFSVMLGPAPHLDMTYSIFGEVTEGLEVLEALEALPTRREGIFVMPLQRIAILSTYVYYVDDGAAPARAACSDALAPLRQRVGALAADLQRLREARLP